MFNGVRSVVYFTDNIEQAAEWYEHILGIGPYRQDESFVGFHLDDCDLCLHRKDEKSAQASQVLYWMVNDLAATIEALTIEGCSIYRDSIEVPEGGRVVQLKDPFGNILGLTELE